jgi:3-oxoacyl-[acyl-carrier-protein] synthase II
MTGGSVIPRSPDGIAITGWSVHVPDVDIDRVVGEPIGGIACPPDRAHELLGRRGLLNKDAATRLALCAVHRALGLPAGAARAVDAPDPRTAVVASSNFGNFSRVKAIGRTLSAGGLKDVSALDAPNASSNVVASTVAMWFRCGGPNLMVCSGATSGLDAVFHASVLLRTGRADRAIVVGAEPDDPVARTFHARRAAREPSTRYCGGSAAIVLEAAPSAGVRMPRLGAIHTSLAHDEDTPGPVAIGPRARMGRAPRVIDLAEEIGDTYGAAGVLQVAVAAALVASGAIHDPVRIVCGDAADGWRTTIVSTHAVLAASHAEA